MELIKSIKSHIYKRNPINLKSIFFKNPYNTVKLQQKQRANLQQREITFKEITVIMTGDFLTAKMEGRDSEWYQ